MPCGPFPRKRQKGGRIVSPNAPPPLAGKVQRANAEALPARSQRGPAFRQGPDFRHIRRDAPARHNVGMILPILWPTNRAPLLRYAGIPGAATRARLPRGTDTP
jgi:hypothetical protein